VDYKLDWTLRARADLREISTHIGQDNPSAALAWGEDLFRHVEVLATFPLIGPLVPQATLPNTRRIVFGDYLIFYRVRIDPKVVELVTVWHAARGLPDFL
jgi:toxin ParE1/3/4